MSVSDTLHDAEIKMQNAIDAMVHDFSGYRTGRATPAVLDRVHVEYYGTETPITQIANVSIPEARQLLIQPYEKSMVAPIERAIMKSDLGINPVNDGSGIRLTFLVMITMISIVMTSPLLALMRITRRISSVSY